MKRIPLSSYSSFKTTQRPPKWQKNQQRLSEKKNTYQTLLQPVCIGNVVNKERLSVQHLSAVISDLTVYIQKLYQPPTNRQQPLMWTWTSTCRLLHGCLLLNCQLDVWRELNINKDDDRGWMEDDIMSLKHNNKVAREGKQRETEWQAPLTPTLNDVEWFSSKVRTMWQS